MKNLNLKYQPLNKVFRHFLVGVFMIITPVFAQAQSRMISGSVHDDKKETLPGVTVSVKGSTASTTTDFTGQYKINAESKDQLVFHYMGYENATVTVGDRSTINVTLKSTTSNLDEIVVIGYGTVKRKDLTGSVASVSMKDIAKAPVRSFDEALAGRVAGVQVSSNDGRPGSGVNIVIRGGNSVTGANDPLYVIDGFIQEGSNNNVINPEEIESIDILKDASATAIYGARGANGVIVIQTKRGKQGKPVFSFNSTTGIQRMLKQTNTLDSYEYVKYQYELDSRASAGGAGKSPSEIYLTDPNPDRTFDYYKNVKAINWEKEFTREALFKNNDLAVRGGYKKLKYSLSGSVTDQDGIVIESNYSRYQGRVVLDYDITNKLKVGINTNYTYLTRSGLDPSRTNSGNATSSVMTSAWGYRPIPADNRDITEEYKDPDVTNQFDQRVNPKLYLQEVLMEYSSNNTQFNGYLEYAFLKNLKLRSTYGYSIWSDTNTNFYNDKTPEGRVANKGGISYNNGKNWLNENTLTFDKTFGKSKLIALGGFTVQEAVNWTGNNSVSTSNMPLGSSVDDLYTKGTQAIIIPTWSNATMASFLARVNYSYAGKYSLTASMRADGSSKFPSDNHWGYFPSGAAAWTFKQENFLKNNTVLSDGKLRFSYGQTGNNRIGPYDYLTRYRDNNPGSGYAFNNQLMFSGLTPSGLGNSELKWETTEQMDAGIDLGFLQQRITFVADVYKKTTEDLLLDAALAPSTGFTKARKNIGSVENKGLELTLNTKNIVTKDFTWSSTFNISFNKNKLIALAGDPERKDVVTWNYDGGWQNVSAYISRVGEPLGQMYGFLFDGTYKYGDFDTSVNSSTGATVYTLKSNIPTNGNARTNIKPGDAKYRDLNGDNIVNADDMTIIGKGQPKHIGGFGNNFTYKNFDLNVFFQWSYGNDIQNANRIFFDGQVPGLGKNVFADYVNRWTPNNPYSDMPRTGGFSGVAAGYSNYTIEDGSYLRLKTVSFGYNVDQKLVAKWHLKTLRFFVSGQNLFTWTNYSGADPEVSTFANILTPGFDFSAYPRARTGAFGVNLTF